MAAQGNKDLLVYEKGSYELGYCISLEIILDSLFIGKVSLSIEKDLNCYE